MFREGGLGDDLLELECLFVTGADYGKRGEPLTERSDWGNHSQVPEDSIEDGWGLDG